MPLPFDATVKEILAPQPEDYVPAFGLPRTQPVARLNVDLSTISAATDVAIGFGDPLQEIVDLNFQSGPDPDVDKRCLLYSAALHFRFGVPVRTILVLLRPNSIYDGVTVMHDSSAFELIMEKGALRELQRVLLRQAQQRLGAPDESTATALKAITDLDRLERLADAVLTVSSWRELLATP